MTCIMYEMVVFVNVLCLACIHLYVYVYVCVFCVWLCLACFFFFFLRLHSVVIGIDLYVSLCIYYYLLSIYYINLITTSVIQCRVLYISLSFEK
jgi:hypothetical protein